MAHFVLVHPSKLRARNEVTTAHHRPNGSALLRRSTFFTFAALFLFASTSVMASAPALAKSGQKIIGIPTIPQISTPAFRASPPNRCGGRPTGGRHQSPPTRHRFKPQFPPHGFHTAPVELPGDDNLAELSDAETVDIIGTSPAVSGGAAAHLSSSALVWVPGTETVAAVDGDRNEVAFFGAAALDWSRSVAVGEWPERIVAAPDGTLFVACRGARRIDVIGPGSSVVWAQWTVDAEPTALALTPDASLLLVAHSTAGTLLALDRWTGERVWTLEFGEPLSDVVVDARGHVAYVSPQFADTLAVVELRGGDFIQEIPLRNQAAPALHGALEPPLRPSMAKGLALSPSGYRLFAPHLLADEGSSLSPRARMNGGYGGDGAADGPLAAMITTIDTFRGVAFDPGEFDVSRVGHLKKSMPRSKRRFSGFSNGVRLPTAALHHPTRSLLYVACIGTDIVEIFNSRVDNPQAFSLGSLRVAGGPAGLAQSSDGSSLLVLSAFSRELSRWDIPTDAPIPFEPAARGSLRRSPLDDEMQLGRTLFHSVRPQISGSGLACASCHPDGREDKRVWSLHLGPRQTPMLAGRLHGTAPYNWLGSERTLEHNIDNTIGRLGGHGIDAIERQALARYIERGLRPVDNPHLSAEGNLTATQENGKSVFERADVGCAGCHQPDQRFSDPFRWEVGTTSQPEEMLWRIAARLDSSPDVHTSSPTTVFGRLASATVGVALGEMPAVPIAYDTPSLHGLFATAPFLHDGSAKSLRAVLAKTSHQGTMGNTAHLEKEELDALVAFLETL